MKLVVQRLKPRNPLVAPSLRRKACVHRPGVGSRRRADEASLRRELHRLVESSP